MNEDMGKEGLEIIMWVEETKLGEERITSYLILSGFVLAIKIHPDGCNRSHLVRHKAEQIKEVVKESLPLPLLCGPSCPQM